MRILTLVDDFGRCDGREPVLHGQCFAVWNSLQPAASCCKLQQVAGMLQQLAASGLIDVYDDPESGKRVLQVEQWQERIRAGCVSKWPGKPENLLQVAASCSKLLPPSSSSSPSPSPAPAPPRARADSDSDPPNGDWIQHAEAKRTLPDPVHLGFWRLVGHLPPRRGRWF